MLEAVVRPTPILKEIKTVNIWFAFKAVDVLVARLEMRLPQQAGEVPSFVQSMGQGR